MRTSWFLLFAIGCGIFSRPVIAADWPQWRGPQRDGISHETGLLKEWPRTGPKLLWQVNDIGLGYSTPSVVGQRLYLLGNAGLENEFVRALNVNVGVRDMAEGTITIDGVGSTLITFGTGVGENIILLGRDFDASVVGGFGTMTVSGGGFVSTAVLVVGRGSAAGNLLTVTDPGSVLRLSNDEGSAFGDPNDGGFLRAGRGDGDVGEIRVLNGGQIYVTSGPTKFGPVAQLARNDGATGVLLIDGAGADPGTTFLEVFTANPLNSRGPLFHAGRGGTAR